MKKVVTRIAPSPTGEMHIGTVRTALFNYLFAKQRGGTYFVRIEDTDKERHKEEWVDAIWRDFEWCDLVPDAKYRQSEHVDRHRELLKKLVDSDKAYISKEPKKDDPSQTVEVVRLRNPGTNITFNDLVRGDITFDTTELGDFVIARRIDDPLYHFAVVADDGDAGVTHVIRGDDHISNTPRQILILEALGFPRPEYAHLPLILAPDRAKLSKRKHGATLEKYRQGGFVAPAIINYLALLGWNPGTEQEIFSLDELIRDFDVAKIHKAGAVFDMEKMRWFNREYLLKSSGEEFATNALERLRAAIPSEKWDETIARKILPLVRERISVWGDIATLAAEGEFDYFFGAPQLDTAKISMKKIDAATTVRHLEHVATTLKNLDDFSAESIKNALWDYATQEGRGAVLWPLRYSLTGREKSPDPFIVGSVLGKEEAVARVRKGIAALS